MENPSKPSPIKHRTRFQQDQELQQLQKMLSQGYTDAEAMEALKLNYRNYWRYKAKLYKRSAEVQAKQNEATLIYEKDNLKERLIRIFRSMEICVNDHSLPARDRGYCAEVAHQIGVDILKLEVEGMRISSGANRIVNNDQTRRLVEHTRQLEGKGDVVLYEPPATATPETSEPSESEQGET
jgi:hypothetical protein